MNGFHSGRFALRRRTIQVALGCLWILDGLLKFQPALWRAGFVKTVVTPNADGQPEPLSWLVDHTAGLLLHGQGIWVASFGLIEIAIGIGLIYRRTVKVALMASFVWAGLVWVIGEGLGGTLSGGSPLMGTPGASYLYALVGALVWPVPEPRPSPPGVASSSIGAGRWGVAGGLGLWGALWTMQAMLWLQPANRSAGAIKSQITSMSGGEPGWYAHFLNQIGTAFAGVGGPVAVVLAAASVVIAVGPLFSRRPELFIGAGLVVGFCYWVSGEALGQLLTLGGTDPNNYPPLVLLGLGLVPVVRTDASVPVPAVYLYRRHRLVANLSACLAVAAPALLVVVPAASSTAASAASTPPSTAQQEKGMTPGLPLVDPVDLNTVTPNTLRVRLVAEPTRFDISGKEVWGESYNGDYVGPTLHLVPGEQLYITLVNKLATPTDLHFHGLHVSPSGNADNPFISVPPGRSFTYHLTIPLDQPLGTFWYHDHDMCMGNEQMAMPGMAGNGSSTPGCSDIESQIYDGLSGTIIVGDDRSLLPPSLQHIAVHTLVLKDMQITATDHIVQNSSTYTILSSNPTVRLVDGQLQPTLTLRPGQTELWRIANEGADIFYDLQLDGYKFTVIGQDGYPVAKVTTVDTLDLPPAKRWDVLVTANSKPGATWLQTRPINNGPQGDTYPDVKLMKLEIAGSPEEPLPMPAGSLPTAEASLAGAHIAQYRTVRLSENADGTVMYINGKQFDPNQSIFSTPAILGTTEQWTIINETGEIHPFHLHTDHFQVMSINGVAQPFTGQQDIIPVPYSVNGIPGVVVIRIQFTDWTGRIMFHCHIAAHEDAGMMSFINVVKP